MPQELRHRICIIAAALSVFFLNLGLPELWDGDEPLYAACAREMSDRGDWIVPTFNDEILTDKPILMYWFMIAAYRMFGVSEFAARFWSAVFAVGTVLLTYRIGRLCYRAEVGLWGALALVASLMFGVCARAATPDSMLTFLTTLAMYVFLRDLPACASPRLGSIIFDGSADSKSRQTSTALPSRWVTYALVYAAMGFGVLAKGPVGLVLPTGVLVLFAICMRFLELSQGETAADRRDFRSVLMRLWRCLSPLPLASQILKLRPFTAFMIVALVSIPWYAWVGLRTDGRWLQGFFGTHNFGRFLKPMEGHGGSVFYYLLSLFPGCFPWSIFLPLATVRIVLRIRNGHAWKIADMFMACWAMTYLGFFSVASTKLPSYVLPAYPALALIIGCCVDSLVTDFAGVPQRLVRLGLGVLPVLGLAFWIAIPVATDRLFPGEPLSGWAGTIPLAGGLLSLHSFWRAKPRRAICAFALTSILFATALFGISALEVNVHQTSASLMACIRAESPEGSQIGAFRFFQHSMAYYARQPIRRLGSPEQVGEFFRTSPRAYLITQEGQLDAVLPKLPADVVVIARRPRFLVPGQIVVLGRNRAVPTVAGALGEINAL